MKAFAIRDKEISEDKDLAYLIYFERYKRFYIEIPDGADEWEVPLIISSYVKRGEKTVKAYWSKKWVQQRIVPIDRQNIGSILRDNNLLEYDEYELLMLDNGRCCQDCCYLVPVDQNIIEAKFKDRFAKRVDDVIPLNKHSLLVFFRDGKISICDIEKLKGNDRTYKNILANEDLFKKVSVQPGGYGVCWGENLNIFDKELYLNGFDLPLSMEDFIYFAKERIVSTAEAAEMLDCSRQNISDLISRGKLNPVKTEPKNKYFLKKDILERLWD